MSARGGRGAVVGRGCPAKGLDGASDGEALDRPLVRGLLPWVIHPPPPPKMDSQWGMHSNLNPEGHGGLAVRHVAEGVEVGLLEGVLVLPSLLGGGLVGGEEERGALRPHMTLLRLVGGGVWPPGAGLDDIINVVGMQPDLQGRDIGVVLQDPLQLVGEGARRLVGGEEGAGEADAGIDGARGDRHLGVRVGGEVRAAQPLGVSIATSAHGSPGSLCPVDQRGQQRHLGGNAREQR